MARNGVKTGGRRKGSLNKVNQDLRGKITTFLSAQFAKVQSDFEELSPKDRVKLYCDMLQYGLPKLQATTLDIDPESLTDEQLDYIIESLKNGHQ